MSTGATSRQILAAAQASYYVTAGEAQKNYCRDLAFHLGRYDLRFLSIETYRVVLAGLSNADKILRFRQQAVFDHRLYGGQSETP